MADAVKIVCATCGQANRVPLVRLMDAPKCGACGDVLVTGKVTALDLAAHDRMVRSDELPLVVDYWAPWCGPCRMMAPEFAKAAEALKARARFAKIDTQDHPEVSQRLGIRGIPLLILWHRGREVARLPGARPAAEIAEFVRANTARAA